MQWECLGGVGGVTVVDVDSECISGEGGGGVTQMWTLSAFGRSMSVIRGEEAMKARVPHAEMGRRIGDMHFIITYRSGGHPDCKSIEYYPSLSVIRGE